ncbi:hypothetical protein RUND412_007957 [Rhizina undulata]
MPDFGNPEEDVYPENFAMDPAEPALMQGKPHEEQFGQVKVHDLSSSKSGTAYFRIADALFPSTAPKYNKDDIMGDGGIRNFLPIAELMDLVSEFDGRTLYFRFSDYVQDHVKEKRVRKYPNNLFLTFGGQLKDSTGSKIGFGERMLNFIESLNPDYLDAPGDQSDFFYPPTRRCDPP